LGDFSINIYLTLKFSLLRQYYFASKYLSFGFFLIRSACSLTKNLSSLKSTFSWEYLKKKAPNNPKTFNEKILYRMAYDRNELFKIISDKILVRNYVSEIIGEQYLTKLYASAESLNDIKFETLPETFVAKVNHGSGGLLGVWNGTPKNVSLPTKSKEIRWARYWVHPEKFNKDCALKMFDYWLNSDYGSQSLRTPEWAYQNMDRRILIEETLINEKGGLATQLNFWVFNGKVRMISVAGRNDAGHHTFAFFTQGWEQIQMQVFIKKLYPTSSPVPDKPDNLLQMIEVTELLSGNLDFVRVDLYNIEQRIVFGEMTVYPSAGECAYIPKKWTETLGSWWELNPMMSSHE